VGGCRLRMSLKVLRISSMNTSQKCVYPLQIVYAYLVLGALSPDPHRDSAPGPRWGLPSPRSPVPTLHPNPGYATDEQIGRPCVGLTDTSDRSASRNHELHDFATPL